MDHVLNFFDEVDNSLGIVVADVPSAEESLFIEMLEGEGALNKQIRVGLQLIINSLERCLFPDIR